MYAPVYDTFPYQLVILARLLFCPVVSFILFISVVVISNIVERIKKSRK
jgi:hypothetical protein